MNISELKQRIVNVKDTKFCYKIAKNEIDNLYVIILYFMAIETNIDTGHTRNLWVQAINRVSNSLRKIIPLPNYDIWKNYVFLDNLKESDTITVNYGNFGITVNSDDEVWKSENHNVARVDYGTYPKRINDKLEARKSQYIGILGTDYVEFYVDKLLSEIEYVLKGGRNSKLVDISIILQSYTKRLKEYIEKGK